MYEGCFLQTRFLKILNVFVDQRTRPSICFNTRLSLWNTQASFWNTPPSFSRFKKKLKARPSVWKSQPCVCVITRPMLSQPTTVHSFVLPKSSLSCLTVAFGSFIIASKEVTSAKSFRFDWRFSGTFFM